MFIKNAWYIAAEPAELDAKIVSRTILGHRMAIFRTESGTLCAFDDRCPHRLVPLSLGTVVGDNLRCAYHGAEFGSDGRCIKVPGQSAVPSAVSVRSFPVSYRYGYVWVWPGDAHLANEASIPTAFAAADDPGWLGGYGHFESIKADYRLINDNLFDITHAEFVHPESFAGVELQFYRNARAGTDFVDRGMTYNIESNSIHYRTSAEKLGDEGSPFWREMLAQSRGVGSWKQPINYKLEVNWWAPSFLSFRIGIRPFDEPNAKPVEVYNLHAATPETELSSHYFYRTVRNYGDPSMQQVFLNAFDFVFGQDLKILEGQQKVLGSQDLLDVRPVSFRGDLLQIEARKILARLGAEDAATN